METQVPRRHALASRPIRPPFPGRLRLEQGGKLGAPTRRHRQAGPGDREQRRGDDLGTARDLGSARVVLFVLFTDVSRGCAV